MTIDTNTMVSISEANQNFSKVARLVDERGSAVILSMIPPMNYENSVVSCGITVCATMMMPPPLISCFIPN